MHKNDEWVGYMCKTDFLYERGLPAKGNTVYSSIENLKQKHPCVENCGIVKVKVVLEAVVSDGTDV